MKKMLFVLIGVIAFTLILSADCYVTNADMESWNNNGASGPPDYWKWDEPSFQASQESTTIHSGNYSVKLTWDQNNDNYEFYNDLDGSTYGGNDFELSGYIYDNDTSGRVLLKVLWQKSDLSIIGVDSTAFSTNTSGWQYLTTGKITAPANASRVFLSIVTEGEVGWDGDATIYADDINLCDYTNPLPVQLGTFYALYNNEELTLHWKTYSEINNSRWNIYKSTIDNFESALKINRNIIFGNGTTSEIHYYTFKDNTPVETGKTYFYWIESLDNAGNSELYNPITIEIKNNEHSNTPPNIEKEILHQNYPNPFNPHTKIEFNLDTGEKASIKIYNIKGELVKTLFDKKCQGETFVIWNGRDKNENEVPSGIYFYKLTSSKQTSVKKMILLK